MEYMSPLQSVKREKLDTPLSQNYQKLAFRLPAPSICHFFLEEHSNRTAKCWRISHLIWSATISKQIDHSCPMKRFPLDEWSGHNAKCLWSSNQISRPQIWSKQYYSDSTTGTVRPLHPPEDGMKRTHWRGGTTKDIVSSRWRMMWAWRTIWKNYVFFALDWWAITT